MESDLIGSAVKILRQRLPPGWGVNQYEREVVLRGVRLDGVLTVVAPDGRTGDIALELKTRFTPKSAMALIAMLDQPERENTMVVTRFVTKGTQERLKAAGVNWLDLSGNIRLIVRDPGLFIDAQGAEKRPGVEAGTVRSLKGRKAGALVRELLRAKVPLTASDLAKEAGVDAGYTSRVLEFLEDEALIEREKRGPVTSVSRSSLVERWATDAPWEGRGTMGMFLDPRGLTAFLERLGRDGGRYAITGSLAAQRWAPVAVPRLAQVYVSEDPGEAASRLGVRPADSGANVQLVRPAEKSILQAIEEGADGLKYVSPLQAAVDLLTSPGRGPAEGRELLEWMRGREDAWR